MRRDGSELERTQTGGAGFENTLREYLISPDDTF